MKFGFFGKMPPFADFIQHASQDARELCLWFHDGLVQAGKTAGDSWQDDFNALAPHGFLFRQDIRGLAAGEFMPSRDESGRLFPMLVFSVVSQGRPQLKQLVQVSEVAGEVLAGITGYHSQEDILKKVAGRDIKTNKAEHDHTSCDLSGITQDKFWEETLGNFEDKRKYLLYQEIKDIFSPFKGSSPEKLKLGLMLPLPDPAGSLRKAAIIFWVMFVRAITADQGFCPTMFWQNKKKGSLFLFSRKPHPRHLLNLIQPGLECDDIYAPLRDGIKHIDSVMAGMDNKTMALLENSALGLDKLAAGQLPDA